jgi:nicotinamidase-related amidase
MIDKAKISGVQTDFRSYQYAVEQVAREFDGFNTLGWDTGDENGDRICNSYDENDTNKNGIQDNNEDTFTGHIGYKETWTSVYTLINPADENDNSAILALENALNKYLDPELKIRIDNDGRITMMNGMKDPWNAEYEGRYITNASELAAAKWNTDPSMDGSIGDKNDRGAIVIWSKGQNGEFGSKIKIENGLVTTTISMTDANTPDNNESGKDDLVMSIVYTFVNGYGQTGTQTHGFSNNQQFLSGHHTNVSVETKEPDVDNNITDEDNPDNTTDIPDAIVPDDNVVEEPDNNNDVIYTLDTHNDNYLNTCEGHNLPVPHCIDNTFGHKINELCDYSTKAIKVFKKPTFPSLELAKYLENTDYEYVELCGLVSNICVLSNAVMVKSALPNAKIVIDSKLTASFDEELEQKAFDVLRGLHIEIL